MRSSQYSAPLSGRSIQAHCWQLCPLSGILSVCLSASISPELHVQFCARYVRPWFGDFWSSSECDTLYVGAYFRFHGWRHVWWWPGIGDAKKARVFSKWLTSGQHGFETRRILKLAATGCGSRVWYGIIHKRRPTSSTQERGGRLSSGQMCIYATVDVQKNYTNLCDNLQLLDTVIPI